MKKTFLAAALAAIAVMGAGAEPASAKVRVKVGLLTCTIVGGTGFIVGSTRELACRYEPAGRKGHEAYHGTINRFGIDIGSVATTNLVWAVFAPTSVGQGALAGRYIGASAEATVGVGIGANALIGGFDNSVALNPLSIQTQTGANIAAGVAGLTLVPR